MSDFLSSDVGLCCWKNDSESCFWIANLCSWEIFSGTVIIATFRSDEAVQVYYTELPLPRFLLEEMIMWYRTV